MMDFTPYLRKYFTARARHALRLHSDVEAAQKDVLSMLVRHGARTEYGREHGLTPTTSISDFRTHLPAVNYPQLKGWIMRALEGEKNVLWPGIVKRFAQSSGTTDGKSKYIPLTDASLRFNHYRGPYYSVGNYLALNPSSRIFGGKTFILGGSFANEVRDLPTGVKVGDLSAHLIDCINPLVEKMRVPSRRVALMEHWEEKLPALVDASLKADVRSISGVPSWFLTVLEKVMERVGAQDIHEVWPNLEIFFHGGISFKPYRERYAAICRPERMHYLETYNASEGFFAVQHNPADAGMMLMIGDGIFYEFIPAGHWEEENPSTLAAWEINEGDVYEMVISSCNGLWRYRLGDTVRVTALNPLRIVVEGRTKQYINAFGEELMVHNADEALARACGHTGARVTDYTVAPVYTTDRVKGHHQWLIEFAVEPASMTRFAQILDKELQAVNSDYQAKRSGDIFLAPLQLTVARGGLFNDWLASTGKLGGQRKVPRLSPDRRYIDPLLVLNQTDIA